MTDVEGDAVRLSDSPESQEAKPGTEAARDVGPGTGEDCLPREEAETGQAEPENAVPENSEEQTLSASMPPSDVWPDEEEESEPVQRQTDPMPENGEAFAETAVQDPLPAGTVLAAEGQWADDPAGYFTVSPIAVGDAVYNRINGKSWQENPFVRLEDLRYLKLLHYNFDGQIQVGELIVNQSAAEDVRSIFLELFAAGYQIQSMRLIDEYWTGDPEDSDTASVDANNSSAFCYRPATDGAKLSKHAYGKAIDLNPQQNPYVSYASGQPRWHHENANAYIQRDTGLPHVITHEDMAFQVFSRYGFFWGGDWKVQKDYQHFQRE